MSAASVKKMIVIGLDGLEPKIVEPMLAAGELPNLAVTLHPDLAARAVVIRVEGAPRETVVRQGEWSGWLRVKFKMGLLQAAPGMVRFHLVRLEPEFELYTSPVNFDPAAPLFPISAPEGYAGELSAALGIYATTGMVEEHTGLNIERIDEQAFLAQCDDVWREREAMLWHELERVDEGLVFCLFDTPDRVQHMFWRLREPDHPAHRGEPVPAEFARVIEENYRRGDVVVGEVLRHADEETLVVALSDHGFNSFRRGVNLNTWLHEHGFLALKGGARPGEEAGAFFRAVDWGRTKAYALGLGGIYLNLKGREGQGIVAPEGAGALKTEIARGLSGLTDPAWGAVAVRSVLPREAIYSGPYTDEAPDLVVNFAAGYRASWDTALGGVPADLIEDNRKKWAGDHIIDPALVPGVLFLNRPFRAEGARMLDLAPTILDALGVPKGPAMEGSSLLL